MWRTCKATVPGNTASGLCVRSWVVCWEHRLCYIKCYQVSLSPHVLSLGGPKGPLFLFPYIHKINTARLSFILTQSSMSKLSSKYIVLMLHILQYISTDLKIKSKLAKIAPNTECQCLILKSLVSLIPQVSFVLKYTWSHLQKLNADFLFPC